MWAVESVEDTRLPDGKTITEFCVITTDKVYNRGPSMCPGSDDETLDIVLPLLRKVAAKDPQGRPCVGKAGTGGAGHYVKMIHNGIEHGMMSAISEAWSIMVTGFGMSYDEIGSTLEKWTKEGELVRLPEGQSLNLPDTAYREGLS